MEKVRADLLATFMRGKPLRKEMKSGPSFQHVQVSHELRVVQHEAFPSFAYPGNFSTRILSVMVSVLGREGGGEYAQRQKAGMVDGGNVIFSCESLL
jgi:hypothetical protein